MSTQDKVQICHKARDLMRQLTDCDDEYLLDQIIYAVSSNDEETIDNLLLKYIPIH